MFESRVRSARRKVSKQRKYNTHNRTRLMRERERNGSSRRQVGSTDRLGGHPKEAQGRGATPGLFRPSRDSIRWHKVSGWNMRIRKKETCDKTRSKRKEKHGLGHARVRRRGPRCWWQDKVRRWSAGAPPRRAAPLRGGSAPPPWTPSCPTRTSSPRQRPRRRGGWGWSRPSQTWRPACRRGGPSC